MLLEIQETMEVVPEKRICIQKSKTICLQPYNLGEAGENGEGGGGKGSKAKGKGKKSKSGKSSKFQGNKLI